MKLYITKSEDRDAVLVVLGRNGYTVRQGKEKSVTGKQVQYVEVVEVGNRGATSGVCHQVDAAAVN